jgi:hypothetical protein
MQMMIEEEMQKKATMKLYEDRQGVIQSAMTSTLENDKAVEEVLSSKGKQQTELISKMLEDEKYQREAFQALLLQQDHRALEISDQMSMIQNELAAAISLIGLKFLDFTCLHINILMNMMSRIAITMLTIKGPSTINQVTPI